MTRRSLLSTLGAAVLGTAARPVVAAQQHEWVVHVYRAPGRRVDRCIRCGMKASNITMADGRWHRSEETLELPCIANAGPALSNLYHEKDRERIEALMRVKQGTTTSSALLAAGAGVV